MSTHASFWQRMGNMFRSGDAETSGNGHSAVTEQPEQPSTETPHESGHRLARFGRRDPSTPQLREGYQRVVELMDSMKGHFEKQDERADKLERHVDKMVGFLEEIAASGKEQQDHLRSIAEHVNTASGHAAEISKSLDQMPSLLRAEAEAVRSMVRQMEISQESDTHLLHSMQKLSQAVDSLNQAGAAQVQTLERLSTAEREQKEALTTLVREQTRRFVVVIAVAAVLGLGSLVAVIVVFAGRLGV